MRTTPAPKTEPRLDAIAEVLYRRSNPEGDFSAHSRIFKDRYREMAVEFLEAADAADKAAGIVRAKA